MESFNVLNSIILIGIITSGLCVFFLEDLLYSTIAMSVLGAFLALEFLLLKAPDVAIAEVAVGGILTPVIFIITIKKVSGKKQEGENI